MARTATTNELLDAMAADQYFEACAKCRRAREMFQPENPGHLGMSRQPF